MKPIISLRVAKTKIDTKSYSLGVPVEIAKMLEAAKVTTFALELSADGILYRPVSSPVETLDRPDWLEVVVDSSESAEIVADKAPGSSRGK